MAGLNGGIFNLELPQTKIRVSYAGEKLNHINGTPRENFVPPILVNSMDSRLSRFNDPIFEVGYKKLNELIKAPPNKSLNASDGLCFGSNVEQRRLREVAPPGQLNR